MLARHPRLVYASLTGYGLDGPERDRAGYDVGAFWARSGHGAHHGAARSAAPAVAQPASAITPRASHCSPASWPSCWNASAPGDGGLVATSLLRTGMYTLGWDIGVMLRFGKREGTRSQGGQSRRRWSTATDQPMAAGIWLLLLEADRHWPNLVAALDRADLAADERFVDARSRRRNSADLIAGARRGVRRVVVRTS